MLDVYARLLFMSDAFNKTDVKKMVFFLTNVNIRHSQSEMFVYLRKEQL